MSRYQLDRQQARVWELEAELRRTTDAWKEAERENAPEDTIAFLFRKVLREEEAIREETQVLRQFKEKSEEDEKAEAASVALVARLQEDMEQEEADARLACEMSEQLNGGGGMY